MDLAKLRLFTKVAELGSLTRAAVSLRTAQSALSRRIAALENECGGRLFHRTGRGVALSELGQRLLPRVRALLAEADAIAGEAKTISKVITGTVNIGVSPATAYPLVPILFERCRRRFPGVRLNVLEGIAGQLDEWLANGKVDVAMLFRPTNALGQGERPLGTVDTCLVGPKGDPLTMAKTVRFEQLDGLPIILPTPNMLRETLHQIARRKGITIAIVMETNSTPIQHAMVASGAGYTVSSYSTVFRDVNAGVLQAARIVDPRIDRAFTIAMTAQHPLSRPAREVAKMIREIVVELLDHAWHRQAETRAEKRAAHEPVRMK